MWARNRSSVTGRHSAHDPAFALDEKAPPGAITIGRPVYAGPDLKGGRDCRAVDSGIVGDASRNVPPPMARLLIGPGCPMRSLCRKGSQGDADRGQRQNEHASSGTARKNLPFQDGNEIRHKKFLRTAIAPIIRQSGDGCGAIRHLIFGFRRNLRPQACAATSARMQATPV